jgi:glyoxylase-like metal-dependent hydrolase (beta-lactamase superfamily II)
LAAGDIVAVGQQRLRVFHTPGHLDDMLCFGVEGAPIMIVGDTLFDGGPGRTATPADFRTTLATLERVVLAWPDEVVCYPGHGPAFRLGDRRAAITAFLRRDHGDFAGDATWEM